MKSTGQFKPNWMSPPSETMLDLMKAQRVSQKQFYAKLGYPDDFAERLMEGNVPITEDVAKAIKQVLGGSVEFWINRDELYQEQRKTLSASNSATQERQWLKKFPVAEMVRFGWISIRNNDKFSACLEYFGVNSIADWESKYGNQLGIVAFRTTMTFDSNPHAIATWLRRGVIRSEKIRTKPFDSNKLAEALPSLRRLASQTNPTTFLPRLISMCAEFGVAVVIERAPKECRASGATMFISPEQALLMLSFRYLSNDHFWFTFFHELGHLVLHKGRGLFVEGTTTVTSAEETEANLFAENLLIPIEARERMKSIPDTKMAVMRFAKAIRLHPGIVVGQMQFHGLLRKDQMNYLKRRFKWT